LFTVLPDGFRGREPGDGGYRWPGNRLGRDQAATAVDRVAYRPDAAADGWTAIQ
jgi:hypothetical protein